MRLDITGAVPTSVRRRRIAPYTGALLAVCWLALIPAVGGAQTLFRGDAARTGVYADPGPGPGYILRWRVQTDGTVRSSPAVTESAVFVGTSGGSLLALDRSDGGLRWRYDAGAPLPSSPAVAGGVVVIGARDGSIHAVDARTGRRRWTTPPTGTRPLPWGGEGWDHWVASPAVADGTVFMGSPDGRLRALDLGTGAVRWSHDLGARTRSSPAVAHGRVIIGDDAGVLHAVDAGTGESLWRHRTMGADNRSADFGFDRVSIQASPAVSDGVVYVGSRDGGVYAIRAADGQRLWYHDDTTPWVVASAAVWGDRLWVGSSDGLFVACLDAATGRELWQTEIGTRVFGSPALAGANGAPATLYVADHAGRVRAFDPDTGRELWAFVTAPDIMIQSSPVPAGNDLFFGADDGGVYALGSAPTPPRRAVYWDSAGAALRARNSELLRDYLVAYGYELLDRRSLAAWTDARLRDGAPSVVVFAQDLPPTAPEALLPYLEAGGKVVWTGFPPRSLVRDSTGNVTGIDYSRTEATFGIEASATAQGRYGAHPTERGRAWGLEGVHLSEAAVAPGPDIEVLATDELGRAAAVVRRYGGAPGTGLVLLWGTGADWRRLDEIRAVAEFGVLRRP